MRRSTIIFWSQIITAAVTVIGLPFVIFGPFGNSPPSGGAPAMSAGAPWWAVTLVAIGVAALAFNIASRVMQWVRPQYDLGEFLTAVERVFADEHEASILCSFDHVTPAQLQTQKLNANDRNRFRTGILALGTACAGLGLDATRRAITNADAYFIQNIDRITAYSQFSNITSTLKSEMKARMRLVRS